MSAAPDGMSKKPTPPAESVAKSATESQTAERKELMELSASVLEMDSSLVQLVLQSLGGGGSRVWTLLSVGCESTVVQRLALVEKTERVEVTVAESKVVGSLSAWASFAARVAERATSLVAYHEASSAW